MAVAVIDFTSPEAPSEFVASLHETGFAVLTGHPIPWGMVEDLYDEWHTFFLSEAKFRYVFSEAKQDGFFPHPSRPTATGKMQLRRHLDDKEFFHVFPWGRFPSEVSTHALEYRDLAIKVGTTLLSWIDSHTPDSVIAHFPGPLAQTLEGGKDSTLLRILHYPPPDGARIEDGDLMRSGAHRDTNLLTLLACPSAPGLQVRIGQSWADVPEIQSSLIVNGGVMLEMLSAGYFPSVTHRVALLAADECGTNYRMSLPLFLHPSGNTLLDGSQTAASFLESRRRAIYSAG